MGKKKNTSIINDFAENRVPEIYEEVGEVENTAVFMGDDTTGLPEVADVVELVPEVELPKVETKKGMEKVKVKATVNRLRVGRETYNLLEGTEVFLPKNVADILRADNIVI